MLRQPAADRLDCHDHGGDGGNQRADFDPPSSIGLGPTAKQVVEPSRPQRERARRETDYQKASTSPTT